MSRLVVYGCGDLAWGRRQSSPLGAEWQTGRLPELLPLTGDASEEPVLVSLAGEMDWQSHWSAPADSPDAAVEIRKGAEGSPLRLPEWSALVEQQVSRVTRLTGGPCHLVTPSVWQSSSRGRSFLSAWVRSGWSWSSLEESVLLDFPPETRLVSAGFSWLRVREQAGVAVVANGAETALALQLLPLVTERLLEAVGDDAARIWRESEEPRSGWFTRQRIVRSISSALREDRAEVELGHPEAPLFLFSSDAVAGALAELSGLRLTVALPKLPAVSWWQQVADPEFLQPPSGGEGRPSFDWPALETVLIDHPEDGPKATRAETYLLHSYLRFNGQTPRLVDPAHLEKSEQVATDPGVLIERWEEAGPAAAVDPETAADGASPRASTPEDSPTPAAADAAAEAPALAAVLVGSRPDEILFDQRPTAAIANVWVDDAPVDRECLRPIEPDGGGVGYRIEDGSARHGAIVRIDFEPSAGD